MRYIYIDSNDGDIIKGETFKDDIQTAELFQNIGMAHLPEKDTEGLVTYIGRGNGNGIVIATKNRDAPEPSEAGETIIYSMKNGSVQSQLVLTTSGNIEMNGNSKSFVTHTELDNALQLFVTALNSHVHATAGGIGTPSAPATPMSINISSSETTTIKTGG